MLELIIEPFRYNFMQQALLIGILTAISCSLVGIFIIYKNYSSLSVALSNSVLPGIIIAAAFQIPLIIGAISTGLLSTFTGRWFSKYIKLKHDTITGLIYTGFLAIGIALTFVVHITGSGDVMELLFGNILAIEKSMVWQLIVINIAVITIVIIWFKTFIIYAFDKVQFTLIGSNYRLFDWFFLSLVTMAIIGSIQAVGVIMTIANLTLPVAGASLICRSLINIIILSIITAIISLVSALYISYYLDLATGALIVVCNGLFFIVFFLYHLIKNKVINHQHQQIKVAD